MIVGGGFGGLLAAKSLARAAVDVTLIDRRNHHLFQPLLYQVATGGLSPANIAAPLRALVKRQRNTRVVLGDVARFDLDARMVHLAAREEQPVSALPYDRLIVATGTRASYFGKDEWAAWAPGLKTLEDATRIRRRVLLAFERAERAEDPARAAALLTFVVVGGGPTGVELAGAIAEVARRTLRGEFRHADPTAARVLLVEGAERVLPVFAPKLSAAAAAGLGRLGVEVRVETRVEDVEPEAVCLRTGETTEVVTTTNVFWAAGVSASPLGADIAAQSDAELDRMGRVVVADDCSVPGRPEVFVIGDLAHFAHGTDRPLPGLAPVAMQQGRYIGRRIRRSVAGESWRQRPFRYVDKGNMATIGRKLAVAEMGALRFSGFVAWLAWLFVHLMYLAEFQNRVLVLFQWGWNYVTRNRSARLITDVSDANRGRDGGRASPRPSGSTHESR